MVCNNLAHLVLYPMVLLFGNGSHIAHGLSLGRNNVHFSSRRTCCCTRVITRFGSANDQTNVVGQTGFAQFTIEAIDDPGDFINCSVSNALTKNSARMRSLSRGGESPLIRAAPCDARGVFPAVLHSAFK